MNSTVELLSAAWEPIIRAVVTEATTGHTPAELVDTLDELGATSHCAPLATALRQILAGHRDREQLRAGLDDVDTAILTATLDRLNP
ncbi:MAG: hypothetical protein ACRDRI_13720 [Pseudonocardiaceae bacterium]